MINSDNSPICKEEIVNLLKERTGNSRVGLPREIDFCIRNGILSVNVHQPTINMQENGAAFEGWIIALKAWLPDKITNVVLDYISPPDLPKEKLGKSLRCHYNRFLYRIFNYSRLFPEWFSLSNSKIGEVSDFMNWLAQEHCKLNHSLKEHTAKEHTAVKTGKKEAEIESWFLSKMKERLYDTWQIDKNNLFRQLPVGVFYKDIFAKNAVFPRAGGAIDLWGKSEDRETLHIIELKQGDNIKMGVISEVLFYSSVLYDTCVAKDNLFDFGKYKNSKDTLDMIAIRNGRNKFKNLHSHILTERCHPLFSDKVMYLLSEGLSKFDIKLDRVKYNYEKNTLDGR